ncbi:dihydropyrimidine dehydrogenase, partial [Enterococcus faecalis]
VTIETNVVVGKTMTMEEIMSEFDVYYQSVGGRAPNFMGIPGTTLNGVYSSSHFLARINLMHSYELPEYDTPIKRAKNVV